MRVIKCIEISIYLPHQNIIDNDIAFKNYFSKSGKIDWRGRLSGIMFLEFNSKFDINTIAGPLTESLDITAAMWYANVGTKDREINTQTPVTM